MVLNDIDIKERVKKGELVIEPMLTEITENCIDIHLDNIVIIQEEGQSIDIEKKENIKYKEETIEEKGYTLKPNDFILVQTLEKVTMPEDIIGWVENSGSLAKTGLQIHLCDAHIDPGFTGHITLQLKNNSHNHINIRYRSYIGKLYFFQMSSKTSQPYRGDRYNQSHPVV